MCVHVGVVHRSICLRHFPTVLYTSCCVAGSVNQTQRLQTDDVSQPTFPGIPVSVYRRLPHPPIFTQVLGIRMLGLICCGKCFTRQVISPYPCNRYFDFQETFQFGMVTTCSLIGARTTMVGCTPTLTRTESVTENMTY